MTSPQDSIDAHHKKIAADLERVSAIWRRRAAASPQAQAIVADLESQANVLMQDAQTTRSTIEKLARLRTKDDSMNPAWLRSQAQEALDAGRRANSANLKKFENLLGTLKAQLAANATPRLDPQREAAARDELYLLVKNAADPVQAMIEAAGRGGELAGAAASSYGESLLRARAAHKPVEAHQKVQAAARAAALDSDDAQLRGAAETHRAVEERDGLAGIQTRAAYLARVDLEAAEVAATGL